VHFFLPHLRAADQGHIMATASVAGLVAGPGLGPYNASKFGVVAIMETLHHELAADPESDVGVSVLCPGVVRTNIVTSQRNRPTGLQRAGQSAPRDDARARNERIAAAVAAGMDPADVAAKVIDAVKQRRFWVLSHPEHLADIEHRNQSLLSLTNPTLPGRWAGGD
jgi:short-subunit dehydrogenase